MVNKSLVPRPNLIFFSSACCNCSQTLTFAFHGWTGYWMPSKCQRQQRMRTKKIMILMDASDYILALVLFLFLSPYVPMFHGTIDAKPDRASGPRWARKKLIVIDMGLWHDIYLCFQSFVLNDPKRSWANCWYEYWWQWIFVTASVVAPSAVARVLLCPQLPLMYANIF